MKYLAILSALSRIIKRRVHERGLRHAMTVYHDTLRMNGLAGSFCEL